MRLRCRSSTAAAPCCRVVPAKLRVAVATSARFAFVNSRRRVFNESLPIVAGIFTAPRMSGSAIHGHDVASVVPLTRSASSVSTKVLGVANHSRGRCPGASRTVSPCGLTMHAAPAYCVSGGGVTAASASRNKQSALTSRHVRGNQLRHRGTPIFWTYVQNFWTYLQISWTYVQSWAVRHSR